MEIIIIGAPKERVHRDCILGSIIDATQKAVTWENVMTRGELIAKIPNGTYEDVRRLKERGLEIAVIPF